MPHIYEMFNGEVPDHFRLGRAIASMPKHKPEHADLKSLENAFATTSKLIFGAELHGISKYRPWLERNTPGFDAGISAASGEPVLVSDYSDFLRFPRGRLLNNNEAEWLSDRLALTESEAEPLCLEKSPAMLSPIAYFNPEWQVGNLKDNVECPVSRRPFWLYRTIIGISSRKCELVAAP